MLLYTQYLAPHPLTAWQHHAYLAPYIWVFIANYLLVFIGAMLTLEIKEQVQCYSRTSKLAGGSVLLLLGMIV